jgi:RHS repeat-associated protein
MPHLPLMRWNYLDRLEATARQVVNNGSPETTYYVYDAGGQRVRKVTERQAAAGATPARMKERLYLGGFEIYREYDAVGGIDLERETLHVMDGQRRIALVETRSQGDDGSPVQLIRYQLGNHLGSASVELDEAGRVISYEEYYPYGSASYQAMDAGINAAAKRYRYTGKERDEETGLAYHRSRYYAAWLGRWCSADPAGIAGGLNRYAYASNNPLRLYDPSGKWPMVPLMLMLSGHDSTDETSQSAEPQATVSDGATNVMAGSLLTTATPHGTKMTRPPSITDRRGFRHELG